MNSKELQQQWDDVCSHIKSLDDEYEINEGIVKYVLENDCSNVGLDVGDKQTVKDLMYGTILKSGADAAIGLAEYVAGSQEAFVELMNQKVAELGLSGSAHFTNCVGIFDEDLYCTPLDIAIILKAAEENKVMCIRQDHARPVMKSLLQENIISVLQQSHGVPGDVFTIMWLFIPLSWIKHLKK